MFQTIIALIGISIAAWTDMRKKIIPNWLTFSLILIGLISNFYFHGVSGLQQSFFGLILGMAFLFLPFAIGGVGAGDVKLLAAIGSLLGPHAIFQIFLASAIFGGIFSIVAIWRAKAIRNTFFGVFNRAFSFVATKKITIEQPFEHQQSIAIPYAISIACGTLFVLFVLQGG